MFGSRDKIRAMQQRLEQMINARDEALADRDSAISISRSAEAWAQEAMRRTEQLGAAERAYEAREHELRDLRQETADLRLRIGTADREARDLRRLLKEQTDSKAATSPVVAGAVVSPEILRLRRELQEQRNLNGLLQDRLTAAERQNDLLSREAVDRSGILAPLTAEAVR